MRASYSNIKSTGSVCGVEYATATMTVAENGATMQVTDRLSKFKLFEHLGELQSNYGIPEADIDTLLLLMKEDASQRQSESEIE